MSSVRRFLAAELEPVPAAEALFHLVPVPYEGTVSYGKGTARGPAAILEASDQLELWDGESVPAELGIFTRPPVDCSGPVETVIDAVEKAVTDVLELGGLPVLLGGEHSVTSGSLAALRKRFGRFGVVQFDAHGDLRDTYDGTPWSHGCVMRRAMDMDLPLAQFGVRLLCREEDILRREKGVVVHDAVSLAGLRPSEIAARSWLPPDFPDQIYVTFDVDGLDPSVIPATGTPAPGGLGWYEALELVASCMAGRRVLGFDVVELAPVPGLLVSDFAAARLVYALMGLVQRRSRLPFPA